jgi:hypothetical protein
MVECTGPLAAIRTRLLSIILLRGEFDFVFQTVWFLNCAFTRFASLISSDAGHPACHVDVELSLSDALSSVFRYLLDAY